MAKERINPDCIQARIKLCGEAMKVVHAKQAKHLTENGIKISIETAIHKLLLDK